MKKKSMQLEKRLFFSKATIVLLSRQQQVKAAGGATARLCNSANCDTYDPQRTCESNPRPGYQCV